MTTDIDSRKIREAQLASRADTLPANTEDPLKLINDRRKLLMPCIALALFAVVEPTAANNFAVATGQGVNDLYNKAMGAPASDDVTDEDKGKPVEVKPVEPVKPKPKVDPKPVEAPASQPMEEPCDPEAEKASARFVLSGKKLITTDFEGQITSYKSSGKDTNGKPTDLSIIFTLTDGTVKTFKCTDFYAQQRSGVTKFDCPVVK